MSGEDRPFSLNNFQLNNNNNKRTIVLFIEYVSQTLGRLQSFFESGKNRKQQADHCRQLYNYEQETHTNLKHGDERDLSCTFSKSPQIKSAFAKYFTRKTTKFLPQK